jgi:hypothetical protein
VKRKKYKSELLNAEELKALGNAMKASYEQLSNLPPIDLSGVVIKMNGPLRQHKAQTSELPGTDSEDCWAHRSAGMKCRTCMWFALKKYKPQMIQENCDPTFPAEPVKYINNNRIGRCRRHAPTMNGYPVVFQEDWCGDHKLDETKI